MKKLFLVAAFAGLLGSTVVANTYGDGDDKNKKKECCKKGEKGDKACAGEKKESCAKGEKSSCCKKKAEASATTETTKTTEKK